MKTNSKFTGIESKMLFQEANNDGLPPGKHVKHEVWDDTLKVWMTCIFCRNPDFWEDIYGGGYTSGGYDKSEWGGSSYGNEGARGEDNCNCTCSACRSVDDNGNKKPDSTRVVEKFNFKTPNDEFFTTEREIMKSNVNRIGRSKWGHKAISSYSKITVNVIWDPRLKDEGMFVPNNLGGINGELVRGTLDFSIKNPGNYKTMAHEFFESCDRYKYRNPQIFGEINARLFERIIMNAGEIDYGTIVSAEFDRAVQDLLDEMVRNDWDKEKVEDKISLMRQLLVQTLGYPDTGNDLAEYNTDYIKEVYREYNGSPYDYEYGYELGHAQGYDDGCNGYPYNDNQLINGMDFPDSFPEDFASGYAQGYAAGYSAGSSDNGYSGYVNFGYIDNYGYGSEEPDCDCYCNCPGCECIKEDEDTQ